MFIFGVYVGAVGGMGFGSYAEVLRGCIPGSLCSRVTLGSPGDYIPGVQSRPIVEVVTSSGSTQSTPVLSLLTLSHSNTLNPS